MNKKIGSVVLVILLVVIIGGASLGYKVLSKKMETENLVVSEGEETTGQDTENSNEEEKMDLHKAPDFTVYDGEGNAYQLSDFVGKGKMAVLNIWSSTGRNAKNEIAEFKALADTFKESVEFVSLAIEWDVNAWNTAIKENEMWWHNISDVRGWNSKAVFSYGVNSFPFNIVFSADGTILRKGVKCKELYSILEESTKK